MSTMEKSKHDWSGFKEKQDDATRDEVRAGTRARVAAPAACGRCPPRHAQWSECPRATPLAATISLCRRRHTLPRCPFGRQMERFAKDGFLAKQEFLARTDQRQAEVARGNRRRGMGLKD